MTPGFSKATLQHGHLTSQQIKDAQGDARGRGEIKDDLG
jgi:hypothetical protein